MRYLKPILLVLVLILISSSCMPKIPHNIVPDYQDRLPRSVAVLPVQNETVDMDAPRAFRPELFSMISRKGYVSPPTAEIDSKLAERNIREAGQLGSMTPQEIGKLLNVDAVLYTTVTEWSTVYLVVYASIKVGGRFQLIDTKTGEQLWESEHGVAERKFGLDEDDMKETLAFAALQAYDPYIQSVINTAFSTLPNGPKHVPPPKVGGCLFPFDVQNHLAKRRFLYNLISPS